MLAIGSIFDANRIKFIANNYSQKPGDMDSVNNIAKWVIDTTLLVAGALAIIYFLYSGILYITAAGNPDNVKKGQTGLIYGAIGIAVCVLAWYLVTAIASFSHI